MQATRTKVLPPTDKLDSRIKAYCQEHTVTLPLDPALDPTLDSYGQKQHRRAAEALAEKMKWTREKSGELLGGCLDTGDYARVFNNPWAQE